MIKKIRSAVAVVLTLVMLPAAAFAANFTDVKVSDWFYEGVQKLEARGIVSGYGGNAFRPNNTVTRAEFLKMVMASKGYKIDSLVGDYWAKAWMEKAYADGLLDSYDQNTFTVSKMDQPITRREMAKLAAKATESYPADRNVYSYLTDFDTIEKEYKDSVNAAYFNGLITGYPDSTFKPYNTLTRAEASAVILRIIDKDERKYPSMTIYQKRLSETKSFMNMYFNNFVFNETTGTGFVYNTSIMNSPTPSTLAKGGNYEYDFTIDVMTEALKDQNGYDYMIRYDVNIGSEAKTVLNDYLKLILPYDYAKVIELGNQNFAAGAKSTKTVELGGWTLQYSNSLTGDSKVTVKIYRR